MTNETGDRQDDQNQRRYTWPWFMLAAVLLAIVLAVAWMSKEIARARRIRDLNAPPAQGHSSAHPAPSQPLASHAPCTRLHFTSAPIPGKGFGCAFSHSARGTSFT